MVLDLFDTDEIHGGPTEHIFLYNDMAIGAYLKLGYDTTKRRVWNLCVMKDNVDAVSCQDINVVMYCGDKIVLKFHEEIIPPTTDTDSWTTK